MSASELKTLQRQQARAAVAAKVVPGVPKGPKGTIATPANSLPLAKRIALPLAMRLSEEAKKNGCVSSAEIGKIRVRLLTANSLTILPL